MHTAQEAEPGHRPLHQRVEVAGTPCPPASPRELPRKVKLLVKGARYARLPACGSAGLIPPPPPALGDKLPTQLLPAFGTKPGWGAGPEGTGGALERKSGKFISPGA